MRRRQPGQVLGARRCRVRGYLLPARLGAVAEVVRPTQLGARSVPQWSVHIGGHGRVSSRSSSSGMPRNWNASRGPPRSRVGGATAADRPPPALSPYTATRSGSTPSSHPAGLGPGAGRVARVRLGKHGQPRLEFRIDRVGHVRLLRCAVRLHPSCCAGARRASDSWRQMDVRSPRWSSASCASTRPVKPRRAGPGRACAAGRSGSPTHRAAPAPPTSRGPRRPAGPAW